MKNNLEKLKDSLLNLYLVVKIRKRDKEGKVNGLSFEEEKEQLSNISLNTLVEYIQSSIDVIVQIKVQEQIDKEREEKKEEQESEYAATKYETLLQKEEKEIRNYIRIEHQLKLHCEKLSAKLEEMEIENEMLMRKLEEQNENNDIKEKYEEEINNLKTVLKSYEDQNLKMSQNEKRLKAQLFQKEKEIKALESKLLANTTNSFYINTKLEKHQSRSRLLHEPSLKQLSNNSSICSHSRSKSRIKDEDLKQLKKTPIPIERMKVQKKIDEYRKFVIDKKIDELTRNKTLNKTFREKTHSASFISKERSVENDLSSIISKKNDEITQRLNDITLKVVNNERRTKTPIKKIPFSNSKFKKIMHVKKKSNKLSVGKLLRKSPSSEMPLLFNQSEIPCVNNINIYTGNNPSTNSTNQTNYNNTCSQLNLRQFIFTKCGNTNYNTKNVSSKHNN